MADPSFFFRALSAAVLLREAGFKRLTLVAPFIAYGRQDRAVAPGEAPVGRMLGEHLSQSFDRVVTLDAHSFEFTHSFGGKLHSLLPIPAKEIFSFEPTYIAAPDQGATRRAKAFAAAYKLPSITLQKKRAGRSVRVSLPRRKSFHRQRVLLVDDMADSGQTLYEARDLFLGLGAVSVGVYVTHLIDNPKRPAGFRKDFAAVIAAYDHKRKRLAPWAFDALEAAIE
jgi:ribose-phosphate pyrophosphokinase